MTFSPLTDVILETTKRSSRGNTRVSRVIVHNWAGMYGGIERLVYSTDAASSNYIILSQAYKMPRSGRRLNGSTVPAGTVLPAGTIIGSVPEEYRAWTSGSAAADNSSITFEIQNSTPAIPGEISQAAWNSSVRLLADIAKRYQFPKIEFGSTVRGHKEFQDTSCPGPWLWPRLPQLAADARKPAINPSTSTPDTPVTTQEEDEEMKGLTYTIDAGKTRIYMLFNEVSGFYSEFSNGAGKGSMGGEYINPLAQNWKTGSWPTVTEGHAAALKRSLDAVRVGK